MVRRGLRRLEGRMAELESRTGIALATTALRADDSGSFWMVDEPGEPEEESAPVSREDRATAPEPIPTGPLGGERPGGFGRGGGRPRE